MDEALSSGPDAAPGENSPVYALLRRVSLIDYPGRLCRVLFLSGCNLNCSYCHNCVLKERQGSAISWKKLENTLLASREQWVDSVCITGGEPTIQAQLPELIERVRNLGFRVKLDTNGTRPEVLQGLLNRVDYVAMDYKAPLERYPELTTCPELNLENIKWSVELITGKARDYEFRTTVVEQFHHEEDMLAICQELQGARRYALQTYVPSDGVQEKSRQPVKRTPISLLRRYYEVCRRFFPETILRGA